MLIGQTYQRLRIGILVMYLAIILPLPIVLLDHEVGLLTGDSTHTTIDDHAWLDHAAGEGLSSGNVIPDTGSPVLLIVPLRAALYLSFDCAIPSVRGPPIILS